MTRAAAKIASLERELRRLRRTLNAADEAHRELQAAWKIAATFRPEPQAPHIQELTDRLHATPKYADGVH